MRLIRLPLPFYAPADNPGENADAADDANKGPASGTAAGDDAAGGSGAAADAGAAGGADEKDAASADKGAEQPKHKPDWRDKEIGKKHAQIKAKDEELASIRAENARLKELADAAAKRNGAGGATDGAQNSGDQRQQATEGTPQRHQYGSQAEFDAAVDRRATEKAAQSQVERDLREAESKGAKDYGDRWTPAMDTLRTLGGFDPETFQGILATDDPAKVLFELGANPENYQKLMEMPTLAKRMTMLVALAQPKARAGVSKAPNPVDSIGARGSSDTSALSDDLAEDEWRRRRMAQKQQSVGRPWSQRQRA